jgi:hypothetical protein
VQFLNPALLAGALLFAVPLVIHLLNRQRHKKRPWAAMEFLLRAYQKQRNRLRNENLLLLLLRCLVPIVLALAIARPVLQAAAGLLGGSVVVHHVVLVDGSYSMGMRQDGGQSPFDKARTLVGRLLDGFEASTERNDKVTLVLAGTRPRFLARGDLALQTARNQWLQMQKPEDAGGDLGEALRQVVDAVEEANDPEVQVYVFSDQQQHALGAALTSPAGGDKPKQPAAPAPPNAAAGAASPADPAPAASDLADTLRDHVEQLQKRPGTQVHWIDVGPFASGKTGGSVDNVQLTDLRISQPAAVLRSAVEVVATIRNRGQAAQNVEVTLDVDGAEPMRKLVAVPAGGEGEADFQLSFREPGKRRVRASLTNDVLAADDERFLVVDVRERIRVLLVDGEANGDPLLAYRTVFQSVLDPDPTALPTFAVETVDTVALLGGQCTPKNHDVVVLADVERLNNRAAAALVEALQAGRGLFVAFGERTDADSFNLLLHESGAGPQPFRLLRALGAPAGSSTVRAPQIELPDHPLLREFEEAIYRDVLQAIPVWRWLGSSADSLHPDAAVVLRVTDAERSPLLVARPFGEGKAVFLTSPLASEFKADRWNRLDDPMVAFPLLHGLVKWLALPANDPFHVPVGGELVCSLPARPEDVEVQRPERDGRPRAPLAEEPVALPGNRFRLPSLSDTPFAGFYVFDCKLEREAGKEALSLPFAVNVAVDEGELRYASHDELRQALALTRVLDALPQIVDVQQDGKQGELGPTLLLLTLLFVLGEAALARYVSVRRS